MLGGRETRIKAGNACKYQEMCSSAKASGGERVPRAFFTRDGLTVAKNLLGKILVHETSVGTIRGIITEVESYMGVNDKGSHTYQGRRTERTEPMFREGGNSYVYFTYGMYYCMNITSGVEGDPQAVLIRSVEPADEVSRERMIQLRMAVSAERARKREAAKLRRENECQEVSVQQDAGQEKYIKQEEKLVELPQQVLDKLRRGIEKHLADGPGKMCIAMGITKADNALDMVESERFYVTEGIVVKTEQIKSGKRIGIDYAEEAADYLWRFYL